MASTQQSNPAGAVRRLALRALLPFAALFLLHGQPVFAQSSAGGVPSLDARVTALEAAVAADQAALNQLLAKTQPLAVDASTVTLLPGYDLQLNGNLVETQPHQYFTGFRSIGCFEAFSPLYEINAYYQFPFDWRLEDPDGL